VRSGRSWPGRQRWILNRIENEIRADDHHLSSMFAIFARLTRAEIVPAAERIEGGVRFYFSIFGSYEGTK
jgi:hypothetical protein